MTNYDFLKKNQQLQYGIMFDQLIQKPYARFAISNSDNSVFWNTALVNTLLSDQQIQNIEEILKTAGRQSVIYFENRDDLKELRNILESKSYQRKFEDSWMFWQDKVIDQKYFMPWKKLNPKMT